MLASSLEEYSRKNICMGFPAMLGHQIPPCRWRMCFSMCRAWYWILCLVAKSCLTLCDHMDCSPPGSSVHGIFQARILEWVATSFSRGSSWPRDQTRVSCIVGIFFTTDWAPVTTPGVCVCVCVCSWGWGLWVESPWEICVVCMYVGLLPTWEA